MSEASSDTRPASWWLSQILRPWANQIAARYGSPVYLVGSALREPEPRDIDIRVVLSDTDFVRRYGISAAEPHKLGPHGTDSSDYGRLCARYWTDVAKLGQWATKHHSRGLNFDVQVQSDALAGRYGDERVRLDDVDFYAAAHRIECRFEKRHTWPAPFGILPVGGESCFCGEKIWNLLGAASKAEMGRYDDPTWLFALTRDRSEMAGTNSAASLASEIDHTDCDHDDDVADTAACEIDTAIGTMRTFPNLPGQLSILAAAWTRLKQPAPAPHAAGERTEPVKLELRTDASRAKYWEEKYQQERDRADALTLKLERLRDYIGVDGSGEPGVRHLEDCDRTTYSDTGDCACGLSALLAKLKGDKPTDQETDARCPDTGYYHDGVFVPYATNATAGGAIFRMPNYRLVLGETRTEPRVVSDVHSGCRSLTIELKDACNALRDRLYSMKAQRDFCLAETERIYEKMKRRDKYNDHLRGCLYVRGKDCNCGYSELLAEQGKS